MATNSEELKLKLETENLIDKLSSTISSHEDSENEKLIKNHIHYKKDCDDKKEAEELLEKGPLLFILWPDISSPPAYTLTLRNSVQKPEHFWLWFCPEGFTAQDISSHEFSRTFCSIEELVKELISLIDEKNKYQRLIQTHVNYRNFSGKEANKFLNQQSTTFFVLRPSKEIVNGYSLSLKEPSIGKLRHFWLRITYDGIAAKENLGINPYMTKYSSAYKSIEELIDNLMGTYLKAETDPLLFSEDSVQPSDAKDLSTTGLQGTVDKKNFKKSKLN